MRILDQTTPDVYFSSNEDLCREIRELKTVVNLLLTNPGESLFDRNVMQQRLKGAEARGLVRLIEMKQEAPS